MEMSRVAKTIRHKLQGGLGLGVGAVASRDRRTAADGGVAESRPLSAVTPKPDIPLGARRPLSEVRPAADGAAVDPGLGARDAQNRHSSGTDASQSRTLQPIPPDNHDGDVGGPRSLDEVIFD